MIDSNFSAYWLKIVGVLNEKLEGIDGLLEWACEHSPEMARAEAELNGRVNALWDGGFGEFKKAVLDYGRHILSINEARKKMKKQAVKDEQAETAQKGPLQPMPVAGPGVNGPATGQRGAQERLF